MRAFRHPLRFLLGTIAILGAASAAAQAMDLIMFEVAILRDMQGF